MANKSNEIQRINNLIFSNRAVAEKHPHLKEKYKLLNKGLEKQLEDIKNKPFKSNGSINHDQEKVVRGKCKAIVGTTGEPCCNAESSEGYCLIHLKQRDPKKAEEYKRIILKNKFGLTDSEIDKIKQANGTLNNVSKGLAVFVKSQRSAQ